VKYLVFARAEARGPYPEDSKIAETGNDPNETHFRYATVLDRPSALYAEGRFAEALATAQRALGVARVQERSSVSGSAEREDSRSTRARFRRRRGSATRRSLNSCVSNLWMCWNC
jgi:hypothetical protein